MIILENVSMTVRSLSQKKRVLASVSAGIPSHRHIALFAPSLEDGRIFINLLAGLMLPTFGRVIREATISFPVGYLGGFDGDLTVRGNVAHLARLYRANVAETVEFVKRLADLGSSFDKPFADLSSPKRSILGHIVAYSIPFDLYLLGAEPSRAAEFQQTSLNLFQARARSSGTIVLTRNLRFAATYCDMAMLLNSGQIQIFEKVDVAFAEFKRLQLHTY